MSRKAHGKGMSKGMSRLAPELMVKLTDELATAHQEISENPPPRQVAGPAPRPRTRHKVAAREE